MPASRCRPLTARAITVVAAVPMTGCAPSVGVLGAYFPDWLFCAVAGVALTVVVYRVLGHVHGGNRIGPPAVVYPTLVAFFALVCWLIFFQH
jgi:hypothetical protein